MAALLSEPAEPKLLSTQPTTAYTFPKYSAQSERQRPRTCERAQKRVVGCSRRCRYGEDVGWRQQKQGVGLRGFGAPKPTTAWTSPKTRSIQRYGTEDWWLICALYLHLKVHSNRSMNNKLGSQPSLAIHQSRCSSRTQHLVSVWRMSDGQGSASPCLEASLSHLPVFSIHLRFATHQEKEIFVRAGYASDEAER